MGCVRTASVFATAVFAALVGIGATPPAAASCASLLGLELQDTTITAVESFMGGTYTAPTGQMFTGLPAFCRVAAMLTPTPASDINIEVWMPFSAWNGKFLGLGTGSFGGFFFYDLLARYPRSTIP